MQSFLLSYIIVCRAFWAARLSNGGFGAPAVDSFCRALRRFCFYRQTVYCCLRRALGEQNGYHRGGVARGSFACANEVAAIRFDERFCDEVVIFRVTVLDERTLHRFFVRVARDVYRLHCARVEPRVVHAGRDRGRGGVEVLHLLRHIAEVAQIFRELYGVL